MKPTVGRIVHISYQAAGNDPTCRAAIVTQSNDDDTIGVCVFHSNRTTFLHDVSEDTEPIKDIGSPGTWHWPERVE